MDNNKLSIVITSFNHYELLHQLLYDIYNYNREVYEVVITDDASTSLELFNGLSWWEKTKMLPLHVVYNKENVGFLKNANIGVKHANGNKIALISNDVRIQGHIVSDLERNLNIYPKNIYGPKLYTASTGWNQFGETVIHYLEGWFLSMTKAAWEDIGGFDERYAPNDFEDVDTSKTALDKGYVLVQLDSTAITHKVASTLGYSPEREAITITNKEKFRLKWNL